MDPVTKIGTCCYCGTRALLTLEGTTRHELACSSCGAPLHNMKQIKSERSAPKKPAKALRDFGGKPGKSPKKKAKKAHKKKGWGYWVREAFDELEDLFD